MDKWKIFVTRRIPELGLKKLREKCEVETNLLDRALTKKEIIEGLRSKDALYCLLTDTIDEEIIISNPNLRIIANYAVGYENIDVKAATENGVAVTHTPGVLTDTTADLAWSLILSVSRRIIEADRFTRKGEFKGWDPLLFLGGDIYRKTLGIVGAGRIGTAVAKRSRGFEMKVLYFDIRANKEIEKGVGAHRVSLAQLLKNSDFISVHIPLSEKTHHLIGEKEFELMKPNSYLINTSRGPIVDEKALVRVLKQRRIAGAGLDVYEKEPKLTLGLTELDNIVLLPHIGSASHETRNQMALLAAENCLAALEGKVPSHLVNPEVWS